MLTQEARTKTSAQQGDAPDRPSGIHSSGSGKGDSGAPGNGDFQGGLTGMALEQIALVAVAVIGAVAVALLAMGY